MSLAIDETQHLELPEAVSGEDDIADFQKALVRREGIEAVAFAHNAMRRDPPRDRTGTKNGQQGSLERIVRRGVYALQLTVVLFCGLHTGRTLRAQGGA